MKKILSFMLVLAMLAMMCINVAAEGSHTGNFVGTHKGEAEGAEITDGVPEDEASKDTNVSVNANVTSNVNNRYAVDLQFNVSDITIESDVTWNVNTLDYEGVVAIKTFTDTVTNITSGDVVVGNFSVTNYSDLPVSVDFDVDLGDDTKTRTGITCAVVATGENDTEIPGAYNEAAKGTGTAKNATYTAKVKSTDWAHDVAQLVQAGGQVTIATITVSIAPATANDAGTN